MAALCRQAQQQPLTATEQRSLSFLSPASLRPCTTSQKVRMKGGCGVTGFFHGAYMMQKLEHLTVGCCILPQVKTGWLPAKQPAHCPSLLPLVPLHPLPLLIFPSPSTPSHPPFFPISLLLPPFFPFLHFPHPHPSTSSFVPSSPFLSPLPCPSFLSSPSSHFFQTCSPNLNIST